MTTPPSSRSRKLLLATFVAIGASLILGDAIAVLHMRAVHRRVHTIASHSLEGIRLADRIRSDLTEMRFLVDQHVFTTDATRMPIIESRFVALQADFDEASRAYAPLVDAPDEEATWRRLEDDLRKTRAPFARTLALSRANDDDARTALVDLDRAFEAVFHDVDALIRINHDQADASAEEIRRLQRTSDVLVTLLSLFGLVLTAIIAVAVTQVIHGWEQELGRRAALLEDRNRTLDAFAARLAHDLRAPLNTLGIAAEAGRPDVLRRSIERMDEIIGRLVVTSHVEGRRAPAADPSQVAARVAEELGPRFTQEGARLRLDVEPGYVALGAGLLQELLRELIEHALELRRPDTPVSIHLEGRSRAETYELRVSDNGRPGPEPSMARQIVEAHGGHITVEQPAGPGRSLVIALPAQP